jgi:hypothetical protein
MSSIPHSVLVTLASLAVASLVVVLWAVVDVSRRPRWQMPPVRKAFWIVTLLGGWLLVWPAALVSALMYLTVLRRRLNALVVEPPVVGAWGSPAEPPGPPPTPPAGWYPDPAGHPGTERWWDGLGWTDHLRPAPPDGAASTR